MCNMNITNRLVYAVAILIFTTLACCENKPANVAIVGKYRLNTIPEINAVHIITTDDETVLPKSSTQYIQTLNFTEKVIYGSLHARSSGVLQQYFLLIMPNQEIRYFDSKEELESVLNKIGITQFKLIGIWDFVKNAQNTSDTNESK